MRLVVAALLAFSAIESVASYKILVYNVRYGHSHSNFMGNIADILVDAGHNVTSLISIVEPSTRDVTVKSNKIIVEQSPETKALNDALNNHKTDFFTMDVFDWYYTYWISIAFAEPFATQCKAVLDDEGLIDRLTLEKYDVMIVENFDVCGVGLSHVIKPKSLITSSASTPFSYMFEEFGVPLSLSHNPSSFVSFLDVHSFWSRLRNINADRLMHQIFYYTRSLVENVFRDKYGADFPNTEQISSHAAYTFVNSEPLIDYATPTLNRVINVPGIGAKPPQKLDKYWDEILSRRPKTVLLSFGSVIKGVDVLKTVKDSIVTAIAAFPEVTFIWKYEEPEDAFGVQATKQLKNLVLAKWTPQNDLLSDKRLSAFITHGGMGSTQETALRGVPGIFIPIFGDQPRNAGMMQHNGFGKVLDKMDLPNSKMLIAAIKDVLENDSYRKSAQRVSQMLAKKPFSSREQLIKYTEFAAEFGPSPALRPQSYDMSFIEYHNVDIIAVVLALVSIVVFITLKVIKLMLGLCLSVKVKRD